MAIVVDQATQEPYTEEGKPVKVKERHCEDEEDKGKTEVIDLDDQVILLVCK